MFNEHDTVVLTIDIVEYDLKCGDIGAVVHCYADGTAYEVEFVAGDGKTVAVVTLRQKDIRPFGEQEILHARELEKIAA